MPADNLNPDAIRWLRTRDGHDLLQSVKDTKLTPKAVTRLVSQHGEPHIRALLAVTESQSKAIAKWGEGNWFTTNRAIQQATDRTVAQYKASRVPSQSNIVDWCCGVGGELMQLAHRGDVCGVDSDPVIVAMAEQNLSVSDATGKVECSDVFDHMPSAAQWLNADPDRRVGEKRATRGDLFSPELSELLTAAGSASGASIKLAPATKLDEYDHSGFEREWISCRGQCRQQVLWRGDGIPTGAFRATRVFDDASPASFFAAEKVRCSLAQECGDFVFDFDPAVRAAGLSETFASVHALRCLGGPAGFFTGGSLDASAGEANRLVQSFAVHWSGKPDLRKIKKAVAELGGSVTTVKTRGIDWDPAATMKKIKQHGDTQLTLLLSRVNKRAHAILAAPHG